MKKEKIKVLHVAEAAGGVDRYLKTLFKYLDRKNIETFFICSQNYNVNEYKDLTDWLIQIKMKHDIQLNADFQAVKRIRKIIRNIKPDIIYAHSSKAGALVRLAAIGIPCKMIYNPHGWAFNMRCSKRKQWLYKMIERIQIPFTDKVVCISEAEKKEALDNRICKESNLQVIYNAIDLEEVDNAVPIEKSDLNIPRDAFVIGFVGRITECKAPDIFVTVAKYIKEKIPKAYFLMVGDSIDEEMESKRKTLDLIRKYDLEKYVQITGWVDNPIAYMKIMNVGMLISRWEGFGLVIPEYMAAGIPIVATQAGAIPDLIEDKQNGLLVEVDNVQEIANAVLQIYQDIDLREKIIYNSKQHVKNLFGASRLSRETEQLFVDI